MIPQTFRRILGILFKVGAIVVIALLALNTCKQIAVTSEQTTLTSLTRAPVPGDDAPELAHLGKYSVGVTTKIFEFEGQPDIALSALVSGEVPTITRRISVDILYPAEEPSSTQANAIYKGKYQTGLTIVEGLPEQFEIKGIAFRDATPITGEKFPLVIVSHGFMNTPGVLSGLTENLVTKGYVVAAIDHNDDDAENATPFHSFPKAMLNRSLDQQNVLQEMLKIAAGRSKIGSLIDSESIGIMGFSMGGYGALNHAGAGYNSDGEAYGWVPGDALSSQSEGNAAFEAMSRDHIDAVVTFAPWGAQSGAGMFSDHALSKISKPLLVFGGSQDDISGFEDGIKRIFDKASGTERHLLVFQNALHNIVQVPAPPSAHLDVVPWQTFEDPTWRREKLLSVGAHFMTAFFDLYLKGDESKRAYFDLATTESNLGSWEQPMMQDYSDRFADGEDGSASYWLGFKRRQALGLELHSLSKGEAR